MQFKDVTHLVVHCSATPPDQKISAAEIRHWHLKRGWRDIGYHFVILRDGTLQTGRQLSTQGAHTKGHNRNTWGVCLVGGIDNQHEPANNFTPPQFAMLRAVYDLLGRKAPGLRMCGHRDFAGVTKACPSFDVATWMQQGMPV